jgi:hypothetical protein
MYILLTFLVSAEHLLPFETIYKCPHDDYVLSFLHADALGAYTRPCVHQ